MKTIVLHDYFELAEGGGRLSLELARGIGADLGYGFKVKGHPFFEPGRLNGREYQIASPVRLPVWRQLSLARAFAGNTGFLAGYATVLYSGSYAPLAIQNHSGRQNIYYCHTPPRFVYDQQDLFLSLIPGWQRPVLKGFNRYFRPRYERAVAEMDVIVANSATVQGRIKKYLGLNSTIVHPPCDLNRYNWEEPKDFFLSTARLDPLKRVDVIVRAFQQLPGHKLVVVSGGSEFKRIVRLADGFDNIKVLGWVEEKMLQKLLSTCLATVYLPKDEDFGMSPVESMAAGKPVIGIAEGGLLETVVDGENGILLPEGDPAVDLVCQAVDGFSRKRVMAMKEACEKRAALFSLDMFLEKMKAVIAGAGGR